MKKVITYGTYDLLHYGHIRLLKRAKELGDFLIVGVTGDDFDKSRGKINTKQSLSERINGVRDLNIADLIIVEEYEGQKIDDIKRYNVDIFAIGSDWKGKFDYLNDYCKVVYLERTHGVSSSQIRANNKIMLSYVGDNNVLCKYYNESDYVNGIEKKYIFTNNKNFIQSKLSGITFCDSKDSLIEQSDAIYVLGNVSNHYEFIKDALESEKHILVESPICDNLKKYDELIALANKNNLVLMDSIKTAYSLAYHRLLLLIKSGMIGKVVSIDATCTSMRSSSDKKITDEKWTSILKWGPTAMLPVFDILGVDYIEKKIITATDKDNDRVDRFTSISFIYKNAIANIKVGKGIKSEGTLVISGTKGCIYVQAPWWKMDYFEVHFENSDSNKKYFYQLDGEGIRNVLVQFVRNINDKMFVTNVDRKVSRKIVEVIEDYNKNKDLLVIRI